MISIKKKEKLEPNRMFLMPSLLRITLNKIIKSVLSILYVFQLIKLYLEQSVYIVLVLNLSVYFSDRSV